MPDTLGSNGSVRLVKRVKRGLWIAWAILLVCGAAVPFIRMRVGPSWHAYTLERFDLDAEGNIPAWFSGSLLLLAAFLLAVLALRAYEKSDHSWRGWRFLSIVFIYLSMDEVGGVHELILGMLGQYGLYWLHPWVLLALIVLPLLFWKIQGFLRTLDRPTRNRFLAAGAIYVTGAVVLDVLDQRYKATHGLDLVYSVSMVTEEAFEGLGLILFNSQLLDLTRGRVQASFRATAGSR